MTEPGGRHSHKVRTPSLGGVGIFAGVVFSIVLWTPYEAFGSLQYILSAFIIIFLIGVKDDILPLSPLKKLVGEVFAASIVVFKAGVQLTSFHGVFGIYELPDAVSICLTIFVILVIINGFNLIDGINGLSGSIAVLIAVILGFWFLLTGKIVSAIIAFSLVGALLAFLRYNITPAQIFMGDTGALLIGLVCSILTIQFIEFNKQLPTFHPYNIEAAPAVAIGILILPLFDTFRVFITRIFKGRSPLTPDRTHIHHLLIDYGFSHMQATLILFITNIAFVCLVFYFQFLGTVPLLSLTLGLAGLMSGWLHYKVLRKKSKQQSSLTAPTSSPQPTNNL